MRPDLPPARHVVDLARRHAARGVRFALFEIVIHGIRHQTYIHVMNDGGPTTSIVGFMVNLNWVRDTYFREFVRHVQDYTGDTRLAIEIRDDRGDLVARTGPERPRRMLNAKPFPILFADPSLLSYFSDDTGGISKWTAQVDITDEASLIAVQRASAQTLAMLALGAVTTGVALIWAVQAARKADALATMKTEFQSAMSHEMKTPVSLISLAGETLASGRVTDATAVRDYGHLLAREAHHLARLVENVLCYARLHSMSEPKDFESIDMAELVEESVEHFKPHLTRLRFHTEINLSTDSLQVRADRQMMIHALDNLIDNALKHGGRARYLSIHAYTAALGAVVIEVRDRGEGIAPDELPRVFDKFYRGKGVKTSGSGLGLAIVRRIVQEHRGSVILDSTPGKGTSVIVRLPHDT
jgi:signal transduction histidine kinase